MYSWMAVATFILLKMNLWKNILDILVYDADCHALGFMVSYPVNAWLIKSGIKKECNFRLLENIKR